MTTGYVDDAQPAHPEAGGAVHVDALVVRPPMTDRPAHPPNQGRRDGPGRVCVYEADDTTHAKLFSKREAAPAWRSAERLSPVVWRGSNRRGAFAHPLRFAT